jgi:hypothetical protein
VKPLSPAKAQHPISSGTSTFFAQARATRMIVLASPIRRVEQVTCTDTVSSIGASVTLGSTNFSMNSAGS